MIDRTLGRTGLSVSAIAFGAGPVSGLMTGTAAESQREVVARAIECGINWFDTAAGYGQGRSESNLGAALAALDATNRVHVATKVRIPDEALGDVAGYVRQSLVASLERLRLRRVTLLQLHNGITSSRGTEPDSITPADILGRGGVVDALRQLRREGLVRSLGLTGTGQPEAMREVIRSGEFDTIQVPFNVLNPSAGSEAAAADGETDYGNATADCAAMSMGVFAIRVFAGGALLDQPPSAHTLKTPYFPLALYERDLQRAGRLREVIAGRLTLAELGVRYVLSHPAVSSAIIGFGSPQQIDQVVNLPLNQPLPPEIMALTRSRPM